MSYESPIKLIETMTEKIVDETNKAVDEYIYKSVMKVGVDVDRDELIRALRYDRDQYDKGYRDGQMDIVRCKDCIHAPLPGDGIRFDINWPKIDGVYWDMTCPYRCDDEYYSIRPDPEWFCHRGERGDSE